MHWNLFKNATRLKKCVIKLLILTLVKHNLFLNVMRLKKCVIDHSIDIFFVFNSISDQNKTQKTCEIAVSLYTFLIVYCPDKHKTQRMCDEAVDVFLAVLKFIPDWFLTSKMIKKLYTVLYEYNGSLFFDEDFGIVTFCCNEMSILSVNVNNINLDNNFDEDDSDTIILIRLLP